MGHKLAQIGTPTRHHPVRKSVAFIGAGRIGSSAGTNESASPFKARIQLRTQRLPWQGAWLPVVAGMQVQAEIRQGERTVMEYLLSPVRRVVSEAGGER